MCLCRSITGLHHPNCPDAPNYDDYDPAADASVMDADAFSRASEDVLEQILADVRQADREAADFRAEESARAAEQVEALGPVDDDSFPF
jgi:hypothetical protein